MSISVRWRDGAYRVRVDAPDGPRRLIVRTKRGPNGHRKALRAAQALVAPPPDLSGRIWPAAALVAVCGVSLVDLAVLLGRTRRQGFRWAETGDAMLTDEEADRAAIACGEHPDMVWPGWSEAALPAA